MNYELLSHYLVFRKQNTLGSLPYYEKGKRFNKANVAQPWLVHLKIQIPFDRQKLLCLYQYSIIGLFFSRSSTRVTPVTQDHFYSISQGNLTVVLWAIDAILSSLKNHFHRLATHGWLLQDTVSTTWTMRCQLLKT